MAKKTFQVGPGVECDIDRLVSTRLLVQANSGGGKSFTLRRLLEQTHGSVQQIVIDPEGEFSSLREKFDYVLAARQGGDTLADPRTAKLLAERLLELGVSAILDIYELNPHERIRFVKLFLEALVDAPKNLWHPVLVVIDEAHVYCPEKEQAESSSAVKALCSRGRKRGFCAVLATQRLSKLAKDAAAECNNKLIGRTSLDVDMARAGDELGFTKADRLVLRDLEDGEFFAFGPALTKTITRVHVGSVKTRHPEVGSKLAAVVPPPSEHVRALLPKLSDLPAEAEAREKTTADLKRDLANVRRELTEARKVQSVAPKAETKTVDRLVLKDGQLARAEKLIGQVTALVERLSALSPVLAGAASEIGAAIVRTRQPTASPAPARAALPRSGAPPAPPSRGVRAPSAPVDRGTHEGSLPPGEHATLTAALQYPDGLDRKRLGILTGYKRSSRDAYIARLTQKGLVSTNGTFLYPTDEGRAAMNGSFEPLPTGAELIEYWRAKLPEGERASLEVLIAASGADVARDDIDAATGYKRSSRDAYLTRLKARGLVEFSGRGMVRASAELFA